MPSLGQRVRRRLRDTLLERVTRNAASFILERCRIDYGNSGEQSLDIELGLRGHEGADDELMVFDTRETTGIIESVEGRGWITNGPVSGRVASRLGAVVLHPSRGRTQEEIQLQFRLRIPASWEVDLLPVPPRIPRLVTPDDPLHSHRWSGPPMSVTTRGEVSHGAVRLGPSLVTGWLLPTEADLLIECDRVAVHSPSDWTQRLSPFERHNLERFLDTMCSAFQSVHPAPDRIEMFLGTHGPRSTWTDPTLPLPILVAPQDVVLKSGDVAIGSTRTLWRLSRSIWGGGCRITGELGQAVEVALAAYLVGEALAALDRRKDLVGFERRLDALTSRNRQTPHGGLADDLAKTLLRERPRGLAAEIAGLAEKRWGEAVEYQSVVDVLGAHGIGLPESGGTR